MSIENWEHFFKPEVRSSGRRYFAEGSVAVSQPSDTEIQAYIRGSTPVKISLKSPSIESSVISADCTCPASKKGQLCKHIWATLLAVEEKKPEFFDEKDALEKREANSAPSPDKTTTTKPQSSITPQEKRPLSGEQVEKQAAFKAKQNDYRKEQYQKQKQRQKDKKQSQSKKAIMQPSIPENVDQAITYFIENGFPMETPLKPETVQLAKKKLSRIFHPDIGGSHEEIVELNKHSEILLDYIYIKSL